MHNQMDKTHLQFVKKLLLNIIKQQYSFEDNSAAEQCLLSNDILIDINELTQIYQVVCLEHELSSNQFDRHNRFNEEAVDWEISEPWINDKAMRLASAMRQNGIKVIKREKKFSVLFTHDVDRVHAYEVTSIAKTFIDSFRGLKGSWIRPRQLLKPSLLLKGLAKLLELENSLNVTSWFFMLAGPYSLSRYGTRYGPGWRSTQQTAELIKAHGMNIGLHGSYYACDKDSYSIEASQLSELIGEQVVAHRNHYLRFDPKRFWNQLECAGIKYDCSVGYPSRPGFRSGLASAFHPYDWVNEKESPVIEIPLIYMDNAPDIEKTEMVLTNLENLLERVRDVGGTVSILVHPEQFSVCDKWYGLYTEMIQLAKNLGADFTGDLPVITD